MHFILPTVINGRRIQFWDLKQRPKQDQYTESFVLEMTNHNYEWSILRIDKNKTLQALDIQSEDCFLYELFFSVEVNGHDITITISQEKREGDITNEFTWIENYKLAIIDGDQSFELRLKKGEHHQDHFTSTPLKINMQYKGLGAEFICHFASSKNFVHCGLDFGSESSQLSKQYYKQTIGQLKKENESCHLFNLMKDLYQKPGDNKDFYQYEKNSSFLKSIFFINKNLKIQDQADHNRINLANGGNLNLITHNKEIEQNFVSDYFQLPNLKLAQKHADILKGYNFQVENEQRVRTKTLYELKEDVYFSILNVLVNSYLKDAAHESNVSFYLRFTLLVPNIYSNTEVQHSKRILNLILEKFNELSPTLKLKGWEIITLSESDASFLGYFNRGRKTTNPNKQYIVIDCGKGTSDFSVIETTEDHKNEIRTVYRNGFAGAGNLITYAFFESALYFIIQNSYDSNKTKKYLKRILDNAGIDFKYKMLAEIERLKFNYNPKHNQSQIENQWSNIKTGQVSSKSLGVNSEDQDHTYFVELLQKAEFCFDWGGYISEAIESITSNIVENLELVISKNNSNTKPGSVLFTGRSFLFKPLHQKLIEKFKASAVLNKFSIEDLLVGDNLKSVCMDGIFITNYLLNADMVGYPIQIQMESQEEVVENTKTQKERKIGVISWFQKSLDWVASGGDIYMLESNKFLLQSSDFKNTCFIMGNTYFVVENERFFANHPNTSVDLIFSKEQYYVRMIDSSTNKIIAVSGLTKRSEQIDEVTIKHVIPSMYPAELDTEKIHPLNTEVKNDFQNSFMPF